MARISPIRRELLVDASPATAFEVFTDQIGGWWPLGEHSVDGDGTVAFVDRRIVETSAAGKATLWGTVTEWEPPARLAFTWHPGYEASRASMVEVTFSPSGDRTLVTLIHTGWEAFEDPDAAREEYEQGWPVVLKGYAEFVARPSSTIASSSSSTVIE
jgi:uncharacterized protein YndB with AHSA1/START domain